MKIKVRLSILMIAILLIVAGGITVIMLTRATALAMDMTMQGLSYMAGQRSEYWKGREEGWLQMLRGIANIMGEYESIPAEERRDRFDDMLRGTLSANDNFVRIFSIWKPNALDGMDSRYIGRPGSTPTGQYAMTFGTDTGELVVAQNLVFDEVVARLNGPDAKKDWVQEPIAMRNQGEDSFIFRMGVPIVNPRTGEAVGIVTCLIDIAPMQGVLQNMLNTNERVSMAAIYTNAGFILASYAPDRVGKNMLDADLQYGEYLQTVNQAIHDGTPFECKSYAPSLGSDVHMVLVPFQISNSGTTWTMMIGSADRYVTGDVDAMAQFAIILGVIALVVAAVVVYFVLGSSTKGITKVADTLKDIAEGEGDLTRTIIVHSKDEVGDLALYFNKTLEKIKNLVITIKKEATKLSDIGNDLSSNMTETAAAVNEITANIQSIKSRVINQSASVTQTNATMEQVIFNIDKLNGHVENQSNNVSQASSAIEEMVANIQSVTQTLVNNANNVHALKEASEVGKSGLQEVASDIQEIARESEGLMEINSVMENIASQTNLLSMNAAIEAAHAGEAGKGFAVVADEIRKLAESSSEQSKTIGAVLKKIKGSMDKITKSTENVLTRFEAIDSGVRTVSDQEENIRNAMEEQGEGSKQVLNGISNVNEITRNVQSGSAEMLEGSKEVMKESQNLEQVTQEITGGMNEMASGAEQVNVAVNNVSEISTKNREGITTLMREVSRFKVE